MGQCSILVGVDLSSTANHGGDAIVAFPASFQLILPLSCKSNIEHLSPGVVHLSPLIQDDQQCRDRTVQLPYGAIHPPQHISALSNNTFVFQDYRLTNYLSSVVELKGINGKMA